MGAAASLLFPKIDFGGDKSADKDLDDEDNRRRNSLAFYVSQFVDYEEDDFTSIVETVKKDKIANNGGKPPNIRNSKFSKVADQILQGNMKECRNQVLINFKTINRQYKEHHNGNTLLHMICQEGYVSMLHFLLNPLNRSDLDRDVQLNIAPLNYQNRTPLMLCFTPPSATFCGQKFGVGSDGNPLSEMPQELENVVDWIKPGGPRSREACAKALVNQGANVLDRDFHDFTVLHYAAMWGWTSTVRFLLDKGADVNAMNISGRTPLMYAVQFRHEPLVTVLSHRKGCEIDAADTEGYTALIIAVELGEDGTEMAKTLLQHGADPNSLTVRRKTPLKIACQNQDVNMVNVLLDYKAQRRNSAFNLLKDAALINVQRRLDEDDKKEQELQAREEKERQLEELLGYANSNRPKGQKSPYGAWVEYLDKRSGKPFYYNTVTRKSLRDKPKDFKPDKKRIIKDATFGMSFYH